MAGHVQFTKNREVNNEVVLNKIVTSEVKKSNQIDALNDEKESNLAIIARANEEIIELDRRITQIKSIR